MKIEITNIRVDRNSIDPALLVSVSIAYVAGIEAPVSIAGRIILSGKTISTIDEQFYLSESFLELGVTDSAEFDRRKERRADHEATYSTQLTGRLSSKAIAYIEDIRQMNSERLIQLQVEFVIKSMTMNLWSLGADRRLFFELRVSKPYGLFSISHSDWIYHFAESLGMGKYLLVELDVQKGDVPEFWKEMYEKLAENLEMTSQNLKAGDWQTVMFHLRKFFENAKIGDKRPAHHEFRTQLSELLSRDQHSAEGIENLYTGVWKLFEFLSKYIHDKDRQGNIHQTPHAHKEDAYFGYLIAVGLLNFLGGKLKRGLEAKTL